MLNRNYQ